MSLRSIYGLVLELMVCIGLFGCAAASHPSSAVKQQFGGAAWESGISAESVDITRLDADLASNNYNDIYAMGRNAKPNINYINWLRKQGYAGNPILTFWLSDQLMNLDLPETAFWWNLGTYYSSLDAHLCADKTAADGGLVMRMNYRPVAQALAKDLVVDYQGALAAQAYVKSHPDIEPTTIMCTHGMGALMGKPLQLVTGDERARRTAELNAEFDKRVAQMKKDAGL